LFFFYFQGFISVPPSAPTTITIPLSNSVELAARIEDSSWWEKK
jgi:hypothetical protein